MTIYDVLHRLIDSVGWGGADDIDERRRVATAHRLIDRLAEAGLLGQVALDIEESEV